MWICLLIYQLLSGTHSFPISFSGGGKKKKKSWANKQSEQRIGKRQRGKKAPEQQDHFISVVPQLFSEDIPLTLILSGFLPQHPQPTVILVLGLTMCTLPLFQFNYYYLPSALHQRIPLRAHFSSGDMSVFNTALEINDFQELEKKKTVLTA